jgi:sugar phosphate isomerase/epimerase
LAPFTLSKDPASLKAAELAEYRRIADGEGVEIAGLHWLLAAPEGLSITSLDQPTWQATVEFGRRLIEICKELGGSYLVHGSPGQRVIATQDEQRSRDNGIAYFGAVAAEASACRVTYVLEPLARNDTQFINEVADARSVIEQLGNSSLKTMIDCYAVAANGHDPAQIMRQEIPLGDIAHVHLNDHNKRGPGQGDTDFRAVIDSLRQVNYGGAVAVEPFEYFPEGPSCAARAIGYLRGLLD